MSTHTVLLSSLLIFSAAGARAASPSIGFVVAKGSFQLDNSRIWNNATVFDGSLIETKTVPSQIHLANGSEIQLAVDSRVRVFQTHAVLEKGAVRLKSSAEYQVEARELRVQAGAATATAGVELRSNGRVAASASGGDVTVANKEKVLVARVTSGKVVTLDPGSAGTPGLTEVSGCVQRAGRGLLLIDEASTVGFELHGEGVEKEVGNMVKITGTAERSAPKTAGASQAIQVVHVERVGVCVAAATTAARRPGFITAHPVAIIGGIGVVAGTVGGLEAAGAFAPARTEALPGTSR